MAENCCYILHCHWTYSHGCSILHYIFNIYSSRTLVRKHVLDSRVFWWNLSQSKCICNFVDRPYKGMVKFCYDIALHLFAHKNLREFSSLCVKRRNIKTSNCSYVGKRTRKLKSFLCSVGNSKSVINCSACQPKLYFVSFCSLSFQQKAYFLILTILFCKTYNLLNVVLLVISHLPWSDMAKIELKLSRKLWYFGKVFHVTCSHRVYTLLNIHTVLMCI